MHISLKTPLFLPFCTGCTEKQIRKLRLFSPAGQENPVGEKAKPKGAVKNSMFLTAPRFMLYAAWSVFHFGYILD